MHRCDRVLSTHFLRSVCRVRVNNSYYSSKINEHICLPRSNVRQAGELITKYDGGRPTHTDYHPMRKQGGLILGTGGDNSDRALGIFYEGAIASGYASPATDNAIQANVVSAGYGK